jgi:hypothetical protein
MRLSALMKKIGLLLLSFSFGALAGWLTFLSQENSQRVVVRAGSKKLGCKRKNIKQQRAYDSERAQHGQSFLRLAQGNGARGLQ